MIDSTWFPRLERLGSIGTLSPFDKNDHLETLTGFDTLTELGGVLGTVEHLEGFSQVRSIERLEGWDILGFNNLDHVGTLDVSNVQGLTSLTTADAVRLSGTQAGDDVLPALRAIEGDFVVSSSKLGVLAFPALESVGGDVGMENNIATSFEGFARGAVVGGNFLFYSQQYISSSAVRTVILDRNMTIVGGLVICFNLGTELDTCPAGFTRRNLQR